VKQDTQEIHSNYRKEGKKSSITLSRDGVRLLENPAELFAVGQIIDAQYPKDEENLKTQSAMSHLHRKIDQDSKVMEL
jgi:hypothetical protein